MLPGIGTMQVRGTFYVVVAEVGFVGECHHQTISPVVKRKSSRGCILYLIGAAHLSYSDFPKNGSLNGQGLWPDRGRCRPPSADLRNTQAPGSNAERHTREIGNHYI